MISIPGRSSVFALHLAWLLAAPVLPASASSITVSVLDPDGNPVPDVVVYATFESSAARSAPGTAVMDQKDTRFVPHILAVQAGTSVEFPNSDVIAHHVYSFSKPNDFALPLYKGDPHAPITFDHDGVVTLGCNIHDHMLAYIVVVDTDVFGKTGVDGRVALDVPAAFRNGAVHIWSPRIRDNDITRELNGHPGTITFALSRRLRPGHDSGSEALQWSEY